MKSVFTQKKSIIFIQNHYFCEKFDFLEEWWGGGEVRHVGLSHCCQNIRTTSIGHDLTSNIQSFEDSISWSMLVRMLFSQYLIHFENLLEHFSPTPEKPNGRNFPQPRFPLQVGWILYIKLLVCSYKKKKQFPRAKFPIQQATQKKTKRNLDQRTCIFIRTKYFHLLFSNKNSKIEHLSIHYLKILHQSTYRRSHLLMKKNIKVNEVKLAKLINSEILSGLIFFQTRKKGSFSFRFCCRKRL